MSISTANATINIIRTGTIDITTTIHTLLVGVAGAVKMLFQEAKRRDPHQVEFLQAVDEVLTSLPPVFDENPMCAHFVRSYFRRTETAARP